MADNTEASSCMSTSVFTNTIKRFPHYLGQKSKAKRGKNELTEALSQRLLVLWRTFIEKQR